MNREDAIRRIKEAADEINELADELWDAEPRDRRTEVHQLTESIMSSATGIDSRALKLKKLWGIDQD